MFFDKFKIFIFIKWSLKELPKSFFSFIPKIHEDRSLKNIKYHNIISIIHNIF